MFDFTSPLKRKRVKAVLANRVNQRFMDEMYGGAGDRETDRSDFVRALMVIPGRRKNWKFEEAFVALSRDVSTTGLSLCHSEQMEEDSELLIEVPGADQCHFVRGTVQHCSALGRGYFQIGLKAEEIVPVSHKDSLILEERYSNLEEELGVDA